ncbi:UNVERIFIED_CONTAM: FHA domain-containing protein [Sesamum radiatum]|uniref:FHA domain-containing protein n=1 Tax=Sesamum radiatum TaxID=300843 RepID=A0AAW2QHL1_SESRA
MAPRKSAAAGKDDPCPMLKLIMEKGPLSGQTNDFLPGSRIQIGRVVRGNTLAIKDLGVSSKHLLIQVEPGSDTGSQSWTITDLGSSNGTFLNGVRLEESEAAVLSDGDVIKIGEQTSIKVKFEVNWAENEVGSRNVRRNTRRRGKNQVVELVVIDEDSELELGVGSENNLGDGFRNEKSEDLGNEGGGLGTVGEGKVRGRRTRGSVARELEDGGEEVQAKVQSLGKVMRRTRNSKKEEKSESSMIKLDEDYEKSEKVDEIEVKQGRNVNTRTRSSKNAESTLDDLNGNRDNDLGTAEVQEGQRVNMRRTRSSRKEENVEKESEVGVDELVEEVNSGREGAAGLASTSGVKEGGADVGKGKAVVDLEKMTLGEWFDFLEVFLPKQIIDETEEMITEMRQKADRLHEYMLQQKKAKDNVEVAVD